MDPNLSCPNCKHGIPAFEAGSVESCPACGARLRLVGRGELAVTDMLLRLTVGVVFVWLLFLGHWVAWLFAGLIFIGWTYLGIIGQRTLLKFELAEPVTRAGEASSGPLPSEDRNKSAP